MKFDLTVTGTHDLLMHNARLSNPLDPYAKAMKQIHGKRKKTDDDYAELARREWVGSLYFDPDIGPYVPGANLERMLLDAAKLSRDGANVKRGVMVTSDVNPLVYAGSRDPNQMMNDENFRFMASVKVGVQRVTRCRPRFAAGWSVSAQGYVDETQLNPEELRDIAVRAGRLIGLGDWRPRFGRFTSTMKFSADE